MYTAIQVAEYILQKCNSENSVLYHMDYLKLRAVLYFVQAEFLVATGVPCFLEDIRANELGPFVPEVDCRYRMYGGSHIAVLPDSAAVNRIREEDRRRIDGILGECAPYSTSGLLKITRSQTPWRKAYMFGYKAVIPKESIRQFFKE